MKGISVVVTTIVILVAAVVLGTAVVIYGTSLFQTGLVCEKGYHAENITTQEISGVHCVPDLSTVAKINSGVPIVHPVLTQPSSQGVISSDEGYKLETYMNTLDNLSRNGISVWQSEKYTVCPVSEKDHCQAWYDKNQITPRPFNPYDPNQEIIKKLNQTNNLLAWNFCKTTGVGTILPYGYDWIQKGGIGNFYFQDCVNKVLEDTK